MAAPFDFEISQIARLSEDGLFIGTVLVGIPNEGENSANSAEMHIRFIDEASISFASLEERFRAEAADFLSRAAQLLQQGTVESLRKEIAARRSEEERQNEEDSAKVWSQFALRPAS